MPRWAFEKFPGVDRELGPQMKSVGEAMAIGRTFKEALQKGIRSLEIGRDGLGPLERDEDGTVRGYAADTSLKDLLRIPNRDRLFALYEALHRGDSPTLLCQLSGFDPWFVAQIDEIIQFEKSLTDLNPNKLRQAKRMGFSDSQLARILSQQGDPVTEQDVRQQRIEQNILPTYHQVDTCAAEFEAHTPYLYSSYEMESEVPPTDRPKVIILGGGPNRIGQGIEFDYCCCHASFALQEMGYETIMVNCNPETVSTDYDTSDRLYFEPLTLEDVLNIVQRESGGLDKPDSPLQGVIVQYGGQTPLNLAKSLQAAGVPILGTLPKAIDLAEDRDQFSALLTELDIPAPAHGIARTAQTAVEIAQKIGYPVVVSMMRRRCGPIWKRPLPSM